MARILVIDDDPAIRHTVERVLARASHVVESFEDARVALDALQDEQPDLIITDVYMPEMDGIEFLLSLREAEPDLPVIVTSGGGSASAEHLLTDAGYLGATATLTKPFEIDQLLELVRSVLEGAG
jgi:DNA-binding NtrC family response regulator